MPRKRGRGGRGGGGAAAKGSATAGKKKKGRGPELPRTQRKIIHLLDSSGSGDTFRYYNKISRKAGFKEGDSVYLTEKWDGTTVQATNFGVFKRVDRFKKGDPKKHSAPEELRYELREVNVDGGADKWIGLSVEEHLSKFQNLPDGVCVYFEAIGSNIGSRFKYREDLNIIRVFDFSRDGQFLPFDECVALAEEYDLPLVNYTEVTLSVEQLMQQLKAPRFTYTDAEDIECEGYVVRGIGDSLNIAKVRVEDMDNVEQAHY